MRVGERGNTLVGELVALAIVGAAVMMLLGAFGPSSRGVSLVRRRVVAENLARRQMEEIKDAEYQSDPTDVPYPAVSEDNYDVDISVSYWLSDTETFTSSVHDHGLQWITVTVSYTPSSRVLFRLADYKGDR
jgi:type II secretory pathway pseudopilin PulG